MTSTTAMKQADELLLFSLAAYFVLTPHDRWE